MSSSTLSDPSSADLDFGVSDAEQTRAGSQRWGDGLGQEDPLGVADSSAPGRRHRSIRKQDVPK